MLLSRYPKDYPEEERAWRVHPRWTFPWLWLSGPLGDELDGIEKFETITKLGMRRDGTVVQVQRYGWLCHNEASFAMLRRCLPSDQHHLISLELDAQKAETKPSSTGEK